MRKMVSCAEFGAESSSENESGNVFEWVWDGKGNYSSSNSQRDPLGDESSSHRVIRGGSWGNLARNARVSYRNHDDPSRRNSGIGFRISRTLSSP